MAAKRVDLHCHSVASNRAAEVLLNAIHCPECYSHPQEVYAQARRRGMDFVAITDHDTTAGARELAASHDDVIVAEELTCWFPEDQCKLHLLVFGIDEQQHEELQGLAKDIYAVAEFLEANRIAHAVAHPIYRQNDKLERWHLERLLLLFKGFECLNGAHSPLHREAFEPVLDRLNCLEMARLSEIHNLKPRWPEPWIKARTGGSDDHGLLNIGRTWTEFPAQVGTVSQVLECLRSGICRPGGEAGSSAKLAHTFYSVAMRYYSRHIMPPGSEPNATTKLLLTIAGERPAPTRAQIAGLSLKRRFRRLTNRIIKTTKSEKDEGTAVLKRLFLESLDRRVREHPALRDALGRGLPPLGEHEEMFRFVASLNRDISQGLATAISQSIDQASFTGLFDSIAAVLAQQFVVLPYYFAVFHQNKERHLLRQITAQHTPRNDATLKVGLFTDTFDEVNGVGRFLRGIAACARESGRQLIVHTSCDNPVGAWGAVRKNFAPLLSRPLPYYPDITLNLPPVLEVLEWADRQQFDAIHVSTPGPMGLCGWLAAKMLRVPLVCTYHTDFPVYVDRLTHDHRVTNGCVAYMKWFYGQAAAVFSRSSAYRFNLRDLGLADEKILAIAPTVDVETFNPRQRNPDVWQRLGVREPLKLLYAGRVSIEKNLAMLVEVFRKVCQSRSDIALVIAGDGPYRQTMGRELEEMPAYFVGQQSDAALATLYASADLFVFPSRTDTLGQVVMEAQACGLPALVSAEGGPKELIEDGHSGMVIPTANAERWTAAILDLLNDPPRRASMACVASARSGRLSPECAFEEFWQAHLEICRRQGVEAAPPSQVARADAVEKNQRLYKAIDSPTG